MPPRRAVRATGPAPLTAIDADTTAADLEEAPGHLVAAAKTAYERQNDILYAITHRRIDEKLECWQVLHALESAKNVP